MISHSTLEVVLALFPTVELFTPLVRFETYSGGTLVELDIDIVMEPEDKCRALSLPLHRKVILLVG